MKQVNEAERKRSPLKGAASAARMGGPVVSEEAEPGASTRTGASAAAAPGATATAGAGVAPGAGASAMPNAGATQGAATPAGSQTFGPGETPAGRDASAAFDGDAAPSHMSDGGIPSASAGAGRPDPDAYAQADPDDAREWERRYGQQYRANYAPGPYQRAYRRDDVIVSEKDHVIAGLLAIFLGCFGIHKFYLGYNNAGFIMLAVTVIGSLLTLGLAGAVMGVIGVIEGIVYLSKSQTSFDETYVFGRQEWF